MKTECKDLELPCLKFPSQVSSMFFFKQLRMPLKFYLSIFYRKLLYQIQCLFSIECKTRFLDNSHINSFRK
ncbi:mCG148389 [Mus musculus]|nr:mCG148389 [Mus musculus]